MAHHINKWENVGLKDGYYVIEVIAIYISCPEFGASINIVFKEEVTYRATLGDML